MKLSGALIVASVVLAASVLIPPEPAQAGPPAGGVEGVHRNIEGFPENSCWVCHDIVPGATGRDAVRAPNETCFGCHTDGPTYGEGDPTIPDRPHATPVGNHASLVTGSTRLEYGDFGAVYGFPEFEQSIHCTTCHDPHRTFDPADPDPSTNNIMYVRDHTDDYQVIAGLVVPFAYKELKVIDHSGPTPVEIIKQVDQDIVYTGPADLGDGIGMLGAETNACEVCHTLTNHHQVDNTAPGGQSHFDGEDCTSCHSHTTGFAPSGGQPLTGPHAAFGDPDCGVCHDDPLFPGGAQNPGGLASIFCVTCHDAGTVAGVHSHTVSGSTRFEYTMECLACHDQHGWAIANVEGSDNVKYVKARISEQIDVIDNTTGGTPVSKTIDADVVFTGPGDFADGDLLYTEDVCNTCHTLTNHHQNDGDAPGGQSHFDGQDCTSCHTHPAGFGPTLSGPPLVGPHAALPGSPPQDCFICHDDPLFPGGAQNPGGLASVFCVTCHDAGTVAGVHSHTVSGSTRFEYTMECLACHDQHGWAIANVEGSDNVKYLKARISEQIDVIDNTTGGTPVSKTIDADIVFTGPGDFADGDLVYTEDVCNTCHTLTNHHQNDGSAPGGQSHFDGQDCTSCHTHPAGFGPTLSGPPLVGPHAALPGAPPQDCFVCHDDPLFPGGAQNPGGLASVFCVTCHDAGTVAGVHSHTVSGSTRFEYTMECLACHDQHGWAIANVEGSDNVKYVKARISEQIDVIDNTTGGTPVSKTIDADIVFTGPGDFADGDLVYTEDVCNTCHTLTNHHQNDGSAPGGQSHFDGQNCTSCHTHPAGFGPGDLVHPEAITDCSNCHLGVDAELDLTGIHGDDCDRCHPSGFDSTILGPIGTWNDECSDCHNEQVPETGNMVEHTKGHRCVVCHGEQRSTAGIETIHKNHTEDANCVVCHGFIPDIGTQIGTGDRQACHVCHVGGADDTIHRIHERHTKGGLSCLECHADERPPVDIIPGPPVGGATRVCDICHGNEDGSPREIHEQHTGDLVDCGSCHIDASLQDDRVPMPPADDTRRAQFDRQGWQECFECHSNHNSSIPSVHRRHTAQWQWCYNCHDGADDRPTGGSGPATEPAETCSLCHNGRIYDDAEPFAVHERHAGALKCYSCHQTTPLLFDWPRPWLGGSQVSVGEPEVIEPLVTRLSLGAYPNPFNPRTTITYAVAAPGPVTVYVYDVRGQFVEMLVHTEYRDVGIYEVPFEPQAASGIYFVRMVAGGDAISHKVVLTK